MENEGRTVECKRVLPFSESRTAGHSEMGRVVERALAYQG